MLKTQRPGTIPADFLKRGRAGGGRRGIGNQQRQRICADISGKTEDSQQIWRKEEGMSMNREAYKLANEIKTELETYGDYLEECPSDVEMKRYKNNVLGEIKKEKQSRKNTFRRASVAACAALMLIAGTVAFGDEVHAAIKEFGWSISNALGISKDLADYKEIVNTSVRDKGYMITLQEAVVSEEKLVINYTLQREDGQPMDKYLTPDGILYINGKAMTGGVGGSSVFLDEDQKVLGIVAEYEAAGVDLSGENEFRIAFERLGFEDGVKGKWEFAFTASGADLIADTKRTEIGKTFELPDGVTVTLKELTLNDLEQRISYDLSGPTNYILMVKAEDSMRNQVEFGVRSQDRKSGYMQNEEVIDDGRLDAETNTVTMTFYAVEVPEEDARISDDYVQIGEAFQLDI